MRHLCLAVSGFVCSALVVVGCSSDGSADEPPVVDLATTTTTTSVGGEADAAAEREADVPDPAAAMIADDWSVAVTVTWSGVDGRSDAAATAEVALSSTDSAELDPFGTFGSCSGLRGRLGAYSVVVSGVEQVDAVNVWTADRVAGAGIYDADVRVEFTSGPPIVAAGTMTVDDGLQSGDFVAFVPDGGQVDGTFECSGAPQPVPLEAGAAGDGVLDAVEVFAVLRRAESERVVGLAADRSSSVACPAETGGDSDTVVRADGDARMGAITTFDLVGVDDPALRLRVGGEAYVFDDVSLTLAPDRSAGSFVARSTGGVSVEGAFRCS